MISLFGTQKTFCGKFLRPQNLRVLDVGKEGKFLQKHPPWESINISGVIQFKT